jgi:hypothetical protein
LDRKNFFQNTLFSPFPLLCSRNMLQARKNRGAGG